MLEAVKLPASLLQFLMGSYVVFLSWGTFSADQFSTVIFIEHQLTLPV